MPRSEKRENRLELLQATLDMLISGGCNGAAARPRGRPGDPAKLGKDLTRNATT